MDTDGLWTLFLLFILIAMSAFFSASEMALSAVNKVRLKTMAEDGDPRAQRALAMVERFDRTLSVILVGNNVVNIAAASAATVLATQIFGVSGIAIATAATTVVILVFGEVLPKSIAKENAESVTLSLCGPLSVFMFILTPLALLFVKLQELVSKLFGDKGNHPLVTEQELLNIIETIEEEGVLNEQRSELMQSALSFDSTTVQEILTPRVDITAINITDPPEKIRDIVLSERFSRIPVFERSLDNIIGILHTRDYLEALLAGKEPIDLVALVAKPLFVHKSHRAALLLNDFKRQRTHMAVVIDDFGGTMGIVSMEDLLEELVGEIWDEDEDEEIDFAELEPYVYRVSGDYPIEDALDRIGYEERDFDSEYSSVGGWAFECLGFIPAVGDAFEYNGVRVEISEMEDQRIVSVTMRYVPPDPEE
ncbi:hemolysin family protein [Oscillospiraceae bacterium LTW-04]|nr:hemolysin family protein [Oscillospiraceae bacterium MB24-C1]